MTADAIDDAWLETCLISIATIDGLDVEFAGLTESVDFDVGEKDIEGIPLVNGGRITKFNPEGDSSITFEAYPLQAGTTPGDISADGFFDLLHSHECTVSSGTTDSTTSNKLEDSGADFSTDGVQANDIVWNTTDNTSTRVTAVDDSDTLSVADDIFVSGEKYVISNPPQRVSNDRERNKYRVLVLWSNDSTATTAHSATATNASALRIGMAEGHFTSVKPSFTDDVLKFTVTFKCAAFDKSNVANVMMESAAGTTGSDLLPAIAAYTSSYKFS